MSVQKACDAVCPTCEHDVSIMYTVETAEKLRAWGQPELIDFVADARIWQRECDCILPDAWVLEQAEYAFYSPPPDPADYLP